ncbi:5900_t:CDS:2, partial [Racocetra fulgida]
MCTSCYCNKEIPEFIRSHENSIIYEHDTCNKCYERCKNKKQKDLNPITTKKTKLLKTDPIKDTPSNNLSVGNSADNKREDLASQNNSSSNKKDDQYDYDNDDNGLFYSIDEVEEHINTQFQNLENNNKPVKLAFEIELDQELAEYITCDLQSETLDLEEIKTNFHQLSKIIVDRQWQRTEGQPVIRKSEIRAPIDRYDCKG